ncbi:uncharacterized protein LOC135097079 isoform X2 [Scylla paramamosain]|uniref:uncharacterized protein LOC135097079 isoform X2 n=1 Tax=Scylla paramamosain TaxID=85552 RepID=UPI003083BC25
MNPSSGKPREGSSGREVKPAVYLWHSSRTHLVGLKPVDLFPVSARDWTYASKCQQGLQVCVCTVLSVKSVQEIKMPPTHLDQRRTAHQFFRIKNFLRVIGTIDGSHIAMKGQSVDEALYFNWKRYHSL